MDMGKAILVPVRDRRKNERMLGTELWSDATFGEFVNRRFGFWRRPCFRAGFDVQQAREFASESTCLHRPEEPL
jgi:hypothetical protein